MNKCIVCEEPLLLGHCQFGHSQTAEEPETIDEAMLQKHRTLGSLVRAAKEAGMIDDVPVFGSTHN